MLDAPLGLSNLLTIVLAISCLSTMAGQVRAGIVPIWRLALPAAFAAVVALVLLAGVFEATLPHDAEWLIALAMGCLIGRTRGRTLPMEIDRVWGLVRLPRVMDGIAAALVIVAMSFVDFALAASKDLFVQPVHVASVTAFCAGFIGYRAVAIFMRSREVPHVELHSAQPY
ncbi:MAG: hypothetical protein JSR47_01000 [Proteobacteria bacterium]|nr:hypothetical protein [Pseudomonadota bacterium]